MMSRHFRLSSELSGAKRLLHAKNQLSTPGSFFQSIRHRDIYTIYIYTHLSSFNRKDNALIRIKSMYNFKILDCIELCSILPLWSYFNITNIMF